jgi:hypothetical protein
VAAVALLFQSHAGLFIGGTIIAFALLAVVIRLTGATRLTAQG